MFCEVILPLPLRKTFTYSFSDQKCPIEMGSFVLVPFRNKKLVGLVNKIYPKSKSKGVKTIIGYLDSAYNLSPQYLDFLTWISEYYASTLGDVFVSFIPSIIRDYNSWIKRDEDISSIVQGESSSYTLEAEIDLSNPVVYYRSRINSNTSTTKGLRGAVFSRLIEYFHKNNDWISVSELKNEVKANKSHFERLLSEEIIEAKILVSSGLNVHLISSNLDKYSLSYAQARVNDEVNSKFMVKDVVLLNGVTGSGKTVIYYHQIHKHLTADSQSQILFLLPEIGLVDNFLERLQSVIGEGLYVYHSKVSDSLKYKIWNACKSGKPIVVVGTRSSVMLPFSNLRLIIIDEEHEANYKQSDPSPRYHGRDSAIMMAKMYGSKVILGSASPSFESYHNAKNYKYGYVELNERRNGVSLPTVQVIKHVKTSGRGELFADESVNLINKCLTESRQVLVYYNRRGYSNQLLCKSCGLIAKCVNCSCALVMHKLEERAVCHFCNYVNLSIDTCSSCGNPSIEPMGSGTEHVEEELMRLFPTVGVGRIDRDISSTPAKQKQIFQDVLDNRIQILVGTQLLAKGIDFKNIGLAILLNIDFDISFPSYRAQERAFQSVLQVSGRAGRSGSPAIAIIQTSNPKASLFEYLLGFDYDKLYKDEITFRKNLFYPPIVKIIRFVIKSRQETLVFLAATELYNNILTFDAVEVSSPHQAPHYKVNSWFHYYILIKLPLRLEVLQQFKAFGLDLIDGLHKAYPYGRIRVHMDVDPE